MAIENLATVPLEHLSTQEILEVYVYSCSKYGPQHLRSTFIVDFLSGLIDGHDAQTNNLNQQIDTLKKQIMDISKVSSIYENDIDDLNEELSGANEDYDELENDYDILNKQISEYVSTIKDLQNTIEEKNAEIEKYAATSCDCNQHCRCDCGGCGCCSKRR